MSTEAVGYALSQAFQVIGKIVVENGLVEAGKVEASGKATHEEKEAARQTRHALWSQGKRLGVITDKEA